MNVDLLPTGLHGTIFPAAQVVNTAGSPVVFVGQSLTAVVNPTIQHLTVIIESISLAIDSTESGSGCGIRSFVSFTTCLHIVVVVLSQIIIILILVNNFNPGIGNHNTVSVYIVGLVAILNQLIGSHCAALFAVKVEPVVSRFLPLVFYSIAIFVVVVPGTIFLNPTLSCERSHSTTDS